MKNYFPLIAMLLLTACNQTQQKGEMSKETEVNSQKQTAFLDNEVLDTIKKYCLKDYSPKEEGHETEKLKVISSDSDIRIGYYSQDTVPELLLGTTTISKLKKDCIIGDLNNDKSEDIIVEAFHPSGGNMTTTYLFVFLNQNGKFQLADVKKTDELSGCGDNEEHDAKFIPQKIENGFLVGESNCYGSTDPNCCPSLKYRVKVSLKNGKLTISKKEKAGTNKY